MEIVTTKENSKFASETMSPIREIKKYDFFEPDDPNFMENIKREILLNKHTNGSFADEHRCSNIKIFINGKAYFEDLCYTMLNAKESICVIGLSISPEMHLLRPATKDNEEMRLMDIIKKKADEGVKIRVLLYKEIPYTISMDSVHAKHTLKNLNKENIEVRRHPRNKYVFKTWAHHEKVVIVDCKIGFVGGIDLFWGRYDTDDHPICDFENENETYLFPGIDYGNDMIAERMDLRHPTEDYIDRKENPRLGWHDISSKLEGSAVIDLCRHFYQRWDFKKHHEHRTEPTKFGICYFNIYFR